MRLTHLLKTTALTALLVIAGKVGWGQALLVEDFDYTTGSLLTANGWSAHSSAGSNAILVVNPSLNFPSYMGSNVGNAAGVNNTGEDVNRTFTAQTAGTVYFSFLVKVNTVADGYFLNIGGNPIGTTYKKVFITTSGAGFKFGVSAGSNTPTSTSAVYTLGTTYLVVLKYEIVASTTNDITSLYVFDASMPTSEPGTPTIGPLTDATMTDINPGGIALRQYSATQKIVVDGIRVATTWADAVKTETTPPVATFNPANASSTANPDGNIVITFDEPVRNLDDSPITDPKSLITLTETDAGGAVVDFTASINAEKTQITVDPTPVLGYNKAYYVAIAAVEDIYGNGATAQNATFTTRALDATDPAWTATYPKVSNIANTDFNLLVSLDEIGKAYYVLQADGGVAPSVAQVLAGQDGTGAAALKAGSINLTTASTEFSGNISGLTSGTIYDVYVVAQDVEITPNVQDAVAEVANVTTTSIKPEPSEQASGLAAVVNSKTAITLNWTDAAGAQLPAGYLILVNTTGTFTDPADGTAQTDDTDLSDNAGAINVAFGAQTYQFTGLTAGSTYYFKVYSYTNSGTAIDYLLTAAPTADAATPDLTLTSPNGGEKYYAGQQVTFTWTSANMSTENVKIEAYVRTGATTWAWQDAVASVAASAGTANFTIPADARYGVDYKIRITGLTSGATDESDATFTIVATVANIAAFKTLAVNDVAKITGEVVISFIRTANRNQKYVQDATGGILVDDPTPAKITTTYAENDGITGLEGKLLMYGTYTYELTPTVDPGAKTSSSNTITPTVITLAQLKTDHIQHQSMLVKIVGVTIKEADGVATFVASSSASNYTMQLGTEEAVVRQAWKAGETDLIDAIIPTGVQDIVGIVGQYTTGTPAVTTAQLQPRRLSDITANTTGIEDNLNSISSVYPNPFTNEIRFDGAQNVNRVVITSITGQIVKNVSVIENRVDTQDLPKGMYLVTFMNNKGEKTNLKMIKE